MVLILVLFMEIVVLRHTYQHSKTKSQLQLLTSVSSLDNNTDPFIH